MSIEVIDALAQLRAPNTSLVTYYVKRGADLAQIRSHLVSEQKTAQNIKSKATRKAVNTALKSLQAHVATYRQTPENGLLMLSGHGAESYV